MNGLGYFFMFNERRDNIDMTRKVCRGDIYLADLNPLIGSEQGGCRPVLVIQNDIGNFHSPTIIVAALSAQIAAKAVLPTHYIIGECAGLDEKTMVLLEQIRTIDKKRIRHYVGKLSGKDMEQVERCLAVSLDLKII